MVAFVCKNCGVHWKEHIWTIKISCGEYHGIWLRKYMCPMGNNKIIKICYSEYDAILLKLYL